MALSNKQKDRLRRVIRATMVTLAVLLLIIAVAIPIGNNAVALGVENELKSLPLPERTELVESTSIAGKLVGNGNGMQYFGAILLKSELTLDELQAHYFSYSDGLLDKIVESQTVQEIRPGGESLNGTELSFNHPVSGTGYYVVYSWGEAPAWLWDILNMDLRGH